MVFAPTVSNGNEERRQEARAAPASNTTTAQTGSGVPRRNTPSASVKAMQKPETLTRPNNTNSNSNTEQRKQKQKQKRHRTPQLDRQK